MKAPSIEGTQHTICEGTNHRTIPALQIFTTALYTAETSIVTHTVTKM